MMCSEIKFKFACVTDLGFLVGLVDSLAPTLSTGGLSLLALVFERHWALPCGALAVGCFCCSLLAACALLGVVSLHSSASVGKSLDPGRPKQWGKSGPTRRWKEMSMSGPCSVTEGMEVRCHHSPKASSVGSLQAARSSHLESRASCHLRRGICASRPTLSSQRTRSSQAHLASD